jgi:NADPH:quinone reductase-like Zn-dependent oxidoreductase
MSEIIEGSTMTSNIPTTMRAIALTKFCTPAEYNLGTLPVPKITKPDELLIRVRAASVNPVDVKLATSYVSSNCYLGKY